MNSDMKKSGRRDRTQGIDLKIGERAVCASLTYLATTPTLTSHDVGREETGISTIESVK